MDVTKLQKKISAISLGCDKNRVDLEKMLFKLKNYGHLIVEDPQEADVVIVNTCAFIAPAKEEAIENIFEMCDLKSKNVIEKVIVSGCLSQRHKDELIKEIPEVDAFLLAKDNDEICQIVESLYGIEKSKTSTKLGRVFTTRGSYAYLKIAEGCSNACSYCTIPRIKGRYISFPIEEIVEEAKYLAKNNFKEIVLVAQDVTRYGEDLYGKNSLIELLKKLCKIDGIEWIRIHYAYPERVDDDLLTFIVSEPKICNYIDMPLQHIDGQILTSMRRRLDEYNTRGLIGRIRQNYPEIAMRTTFIVGYPGEKRSQFKKLCNFVEETQFDYAGFFPYYREENTPSFFMTNQVSQFVKNKRAKKIRKLQQKVVIANVCKKIGKTYRTLIDYFDENKGVFVGHTEFLSPTVDFGVEIVDNGSIEVGQFVYATFVDFDGENFKGECYESSK